MARGGGQRHWLALLSCMVLEDETVSDDQGSLKLSMNSTV
jgi:hypothetical protein